MTPADTTPALPPRPAPIRVIDVDGERRYFFSGDQLDAYALRSIAADRAAREGAPPTVALPLDDAEMLLSWMDETFGNDHGGDWMDADAASVGDALNKHIEGFKGMRATLAAPRGEAAAQPEPSRPDILEKLTYHQLERDDLTLDEVLDVLAQGWKKVMGRTERQMLLQLCALLAAVPSPTAPETNHE